MTQRDDLRLQRCSGAEQITHDADEEPDYCDSRLPAIDELRAIGVVDPEFQPDAASYYWSASTDAGLPSVAWFGSTGDGTANIDPKTTAYPVRAVRSGP